MPIFSGVTISGGFSYEPPPPPPGGSLVSTFSSFTYPTSEDWQMGTGDFTIEWFGFQTNSTNGGWFAVNVPSQGLKAQTSSNNFTLFNGTSSLATISFTSYLNVWIHYAITRSNGTLRIFRDGTQISADIPNTTDFNTEGGLRLAASDARNLVGNFTQFNWVKGTALYTSNFTPPDRPITPDANSKLLLLVKTNETRSVDSSGTGKVPNSFNLTFSTSTPFNY